MNLKALWLVVFLVTCAACMPTTDKQRPESVTKKAVRYCQSQTPCGWKIYNYIDYPEINFTNDYCQCRLGQKCDFHESRPSEGYIEYRCKKN